MLESELDTLATLNAQAGIWLSVATALASLAAGIHVAAAFTDKLTPEGKVLSQFFAPLLWVIAAIFIAMAAFAWWRRRATVQRIFGESLPETSLPETPAAAANAAPDVPA